jgi:hypothetical protein
MWHRFGFMDHQCALASVVAVLLAPEVGVADDEIHRLVAEGVAVALDLDIRWRPSAYGRRGACGRW